MLGRQDSLLCVVLTWEPRLPEPPPSGTSLVAMAGEREKASQILRLKVFCLKTTQITSLVFHWPEQVTRPAERQGGKMAVFLLSLEREKTRNIEQSQRLLESALFCY